MKLSIRALKEQYISYFADVPVQKYAAMYIGRDEDTIIRWRKDDPAFADSVKRAEADFIRKKMLAVKSEFALERLFKQVFTQKEEIQISEPIPQAGGSTSELRKKFVEMVKKEIVERPVSNSK